jgi:hypothetical protein
MEPSRQWRDIARLGKLILDELNLNRSNQVLDRWMAHRIAELMQRAEATSDPQAKEITERECQDLIVRLWDMRGRWPSGGPLRGVLPTLHQLLDEIPFTIRWAGKPDEPSVGGLITKLLRTQRKELRQLCLLVKAKIPAHTVTELQQLLDENYDDLSEDEVALITLIIEPTGLPIFENEEESDSYGIEFVGDEDDTLVELQEASSDKYADFEKAVILGREQFLSSVADFLKKE